MRRQPFSSLHFGSILLSLWVSVAFIKPTQVLAQAPNISYTSPPVYTVGTAISLLSPVNTGGAVPATIYGQVSTFAGNGSTGAVNGSALGSSFYHPYASALDASGNIYVVDYFNQLIRKITPSGLVSTFAGSGSIGAANGIGTSASFFYPGGIGLDVAGNIYIGDQNNNEVRKITPAGLVTTFAGNGSLGSNNGNALSATFSGPSGIIFDASGNLYTADRNNNMIRKISPAGVVTTFAGNGTTGSSNGNGAFASFHNPTGLTIDASGNIYVADQNNNQIREISPTGVVSTFAGSGLAGATDGAGQLASFNQPFGITIDISGTLYVADEFNNLIRKVNQAGVVSTLAGNTTTNSIDGIGTSASFNAPSGVALDGLGNLFVTETGGNKIRKIVLTGYTIDKALPAGLSFDPTTGIITGTPTVIFPATTYTVTAYNASGSSTASFSISVDSLINQTITFKPLPNTVYGAANISPMATATSGLPVSYTSSDTTVASIVNNAIHIKGVGTVTITASQSGNANYYAAAPVSQTLTIAPAPLTITANNQTRVYGAANPTLGVTYTGFVYKDSVSVLSTLPVVTTSANTTSPVGVYPITVAGATAKNYTITYSPPGVLTVSPAPRNLTFGSLPIKTYGDTDFTPTASLSSGETVMYTSSDNSVATVINGQIHIVGAGTCTITATAPVNGNYSTVAPITQTLTVNKANQTINFPAIPNQILGAQALLLNITSSSGLPVTIFSSDPLIASVNGLTVTPGLLGTAIITAYQAGSNNYLPATVTQTITIINPNGDVVAVYPVVTPNGDGINDVLKIAGIENYPNNRLILINRNGVKIFDMAGYDNNTRVFDGHSTVTGILQQQGTYFYLLEYANGDQVIKQTGFIILKY